MKDFELTLKLRNNHLKSRRLQLGLKARELAARAGVGYATYLDYEGLRRSPLSARRGQVWTPSVEALAKFFGVPPEELFPAAILAVEKPEVVATIEGEKLQALASWHAGQLPPPTPEDLCEAKEEYDLLQRLLPELPEAQQVVVKERIRGRSLADIAVSIERSREAVRHREGEAAKLLRQLLLTDIQTRSNQ